MSIDITVAGGTKARLLTAGKYCEDDIVVTATGGGANPSAEWNDVTFIDYDGAVLYSYSLEEAKALTELPALPSHDGLVCQGWNYDLETIQSYDRPVTIGAMYITDDGKTRIYIHLEQGRTSPMLGCCPNGTVTVDWGDGTEPDVLTGEDVTVPQWTPNHDYANPGDYVISLSVDGEMGIYGTTGYKEGSGILRYSAGSDGINLVYLNAIKKIEFGDGVTFVETGAFYMCYSLSSVVISAGITAISNFAFCDCSSLSSVVIPDGVTFLGESAFNDCGSLLSVSIPDSVIAIGSRAFMNCSSLQNVVIPNVETSDIVGYTFAYCHSLSNIVIPAGVSNMYRYAIYSNDSILRVVFLGGNLCIEDYAFSSMGVRYLDFTACNSIPTLEGTAVFGTLPDDCEMLIPAALYDEWSKATNWAAYSSYMVAV